MQNPRNNIELPTMIAHMSEKKLIMLVAIHSVTVSPHLNYTTNRKGASK